jgi:DNA-binding CsgD family transcriptional regulator
LSDPDGLTFIEAERLGMAESGMATKEIARRQGVSQQTVQISLRAARKKRQRG